MRMGCRGHGMKPNSWRRMLFLPLKPRPFSGLQEMSSNISGESLPLEMHRDTLLFRIFWGIAPAII